MAWKFTGKFGKGIWTEMRITVLAAGKIREKWLVDGIEEYAKRLKRYCEVNMIEVQDSPEYLPPETILAQEGERLLAKIREKAYVALLDLHGKEIDSVSFAELMDKSFEVGGAEIIFVIGGSSGVSEELRRRADLRICLSKLTFTHQITRLLLLEQCYRGFRILRGEPYHK